MFPLARILGRTSNLPCSLNQTEEPKNTLRPGSTPQRFWFTCRKKGPEPWAFLKVLRRAAKAERQSSTKGEHSGAISPHRISYPITSTRKGREKVDGVSEQEDCRGMREKQKNKCIAWGEQDETTQAHPQYSFPANLACGSQIERLTELLRTIFSSPSL